MTETWALSEIVVGTNAQLIIGAELDPAEFKTRWKEASAVGLVGFFAPFLGRPAIAYYGLQGPRVKLIVVREGVENGGA